MRRIINNDHPLFIYSGVYSGASSSQLLNFWRILPKDVKPYFGVHINPAKKDSPENRKWIESILDAAQKHNIPAIVEVEGFDSANNTPMSYWAELFDRYPTMIGINIAELSATGLLTGSILDDAYMSKIIQYIDTAANKGAYFIWQDMGYDWPSPGHAHVFLKAGASANLYAELTAKGDHVILTHKHNGNGRRALTDAAAIGFWTSGLTSNWGVHSEGWLWWEGGNERLFGPSAGYKRSAEPWKSVFTYPPAQYGMEWLMAAAGGAAVFSLEAYFQGYSSCDGDRFTPAFENVLLPLIRNIIKGGVIPNRQQALARIKAAYHPLRADDPPLRNDNLFRGLYGPEKSSQNEWLPSTGRYYYLPVLPALAGSDTLKKFPFVFDSSYIKQRFQTTEEKQAFFNKLYPETGKGDAWFLNFGDNWFIVNPNENKNITASFEFPLNKWPGTKLSGVFSHHTFAIVRENNNQLHIQLSDYMPDSNADVWDNPAFDSNNICDFVKNKYIPASTDGQLRESRMEISGFKNPKPLAKVVIGHRGHYKISQSGHRLTIIVTLNGTADITIGKPSAQYRRSSDAQHKHRGFTQ